MFRRAIVAAPHRPALNVCARTLAPDQDSRRQGDDAHSRHVARLISSSNCPWVSQVDLKNVGNRPPDERACHWRQEAARRKQTAIVRTPLPTTGSVIPPSPPTNIIVSVTHYLRIPLPASFTPDQTLYPPPPTHPPTHAGTSSPLSHRPCADAASSCSGTCRARQTWSLTPPTT